MHIPNQVPIQYVSKLQVSAAWTLNKALKCTFPVTYPPSLIQGKLRGIARDSAFLGKGTYFNDSRSDSCPQLLRHDQGTRAKERTSPPQRGPSHKYSAILSPIPTREGKRNELLFPVCFSIHHGELLSRTICR